MLDGCPNRPMGISNPYLTYLREEGGNGDKDQKEKNNESSFATNR